MKGHPVVLREAARRDIDEALAFYLDEGSEATALAFIEEIEAVVERISLHPEAGSPRLSHELDIPGLRSWVLTRHPFVVFYVGGGDVVDVWRVLHQHRHIPLSLREPPEP